jgi:membrane protease YdiL (CAAX protease family)
LDFEPSPDSPRIPPFTAPPSERLSGKLFLNNGELRAGWRLLLYATFVVAFGFGGGILLLQFSPLARREFFPYYLFIEEAFGFLVVFGAALIMARIEHRPARVYGLPVRGAFGKLFWQGWLFGFLEVSALIGLICAFGGYSIGILALHGAELWRWGAIWAVVFVAVGLFEEFLFRGYTQFTLADGLGFWPAAILLSCSFGAVHLENPGEDWVGAASVVVTGLVFAFALRRTGNLWFAVGWHASFDFGETFLFSVPNSGLLFDGRLSNATLHGAKWLTGGSVGPEGSVLSFATLGVLALLIHVLFPAKSSDPASV